MKQKTNMELLLHREVTRQEFLILLGSGVASILGISSIIHFMTGKKLGSTGLSTSQTQGYGGGEYGH